MFKEDLDLLSKVAWLYYADDKTQREIAEDLGISRMKVQRLLKKAAQEHIVRIQISQEAHNLLSVEENLIEIFNLRDAIVVPMGSQLAETEIYRELAKAAASYITWKWLPKIDILAVGIGRTLYHLPDFLQPFSFSRKKRKKLKVVSLQGALLPNIALNSNLIGERVARQLEGDFYGLWAPIVANSKSELNVIRSQPYVKMALEMAKESDVRVVGIGTATQEALLKTFGFLKDSEINELLATGAVGDILGRFFDKNGNILNNKVNERIVSIDISSSCTKGVTIGVAGGEKKLNCILAALRGHQIDILVTDEILAESLINKANKRFRKEG